MNQKNGWRVIVFGFIICAVLIVVGFFCMSTPCQAKIVYAAPDLSVGGKKTLRVVTGLRIDFKNARVTRRGNDYYLDCFCGLYLPFYTWFDLRIPVPESEFPELWVNDGTGRYDTVKGEHLWSEPTASMVQLPAIKTEPMWIAPE